MKPLLCKVDLAEVLIASLEFKIRRWYREYCQSISGDRVKEKSVQFSKAENGKKGSCVLLGGGALSLDSCRLLSATLPKSGNGGDVIGEDGLRHLGAVGVQEMKANVRNKAGWKWTAIRNDATHRGTHQSHTEERGEEHLAASSGLDKLLCGMLHFSVKQG